MRRIFALILALSMLLAAMPAFAYTWHTVGDKLEFGSWEQDGSYYNGKEPITWRIIAMNGSSALLMSEYALEGMPYHNRNTSVSWDYSSIKAWLHDDFYALAFTPAEQNKIDYSYDSNGWVFLLSSYEVERYLGSSRNNYNEYPDRICYPSQYARSHGVYTYGRGYCWWWLRDGGTLGGNYAASVNGSGSINYGGDIVDNSRSDRFAGVRPCIWVSDVNNLYQARDVYGLATMNLATRTGPATEYTEPGTFNLSGQYIKLISIAYDSGNVPWLQCEIYENGRPMRVYTGLKRFDQSTFNLWELPIESDTGYTASTVGSFTPRMGPGTSYMAESKYTIPAGAKVRVMSEEAGWVQFEWDTGIYKGNGYYYILRAWTQKSNIR